MRAEKYHGWTTTCVVAKFDIDFVVGEIAAMPHIASTPFTVLRRRRSAFSACSYSYILNNSATDVLRLKRQSSALLLSSPTRLPSARPSGDNHLGPGQI
jgi:hypothetical protein